MFSILLYITIVICKSACVALFYMCVYVIFDHGNTGDNFLNKRKLGRL